MLFGFLELLTFDLRYLFNMTQNSGRISGYDAVRRDILGDDAPGSYNRVFANRDARKNRRTGTDGCSLLNHRPFDIPVRFGLQFPVSCGGPRIAVVYEHHAVADEDIVFNRDALANKRMA